MTPQPRTRQPRRRLFPLASVLLLAGTALLVATTTANTATAARPGAPALRLAADATTHSVAQSPMVTAVSRATDKLDAFAIGPDQKIMTTHWEPGMANWSTWFWLNGGVAAPNTSVYAVSRGTDKLDVFVVGTNYNVYTASWQPSFSDGWHGWSPIGSLKVAPGTSVHAVSRGTDLIDLFAVGADQLVYTARWSPSSGWTAWTSLNGGVVASGTNVYGVSRAPGKVDVFVVGTDHRVFTASWDDAQPGWRGWSPITNTTVAPNTSVYPVTRGRDKLDIFAVDTNYHVITASWQPSFADGWHGWTWINSGVVAPNTSVYGASRAPDELDIVAVGTDLKVWTASQVNSTSGWQGWFPLNESVEPNTSVFAVSRSVSHTDIFATVWDTSLASEALASDGWHPWYLLANLLSLQITAPDIRFDSAPAQGNLQASFFADGSFTFSGHLHDAGFPSYDTAAAVVLTADNGTAVDVRHSGHVDGTQKIFNINRDDDWNVSGNNPQLAALWPTLAVHYVYNWDVRLNWDAQQLVDEIVAGVGYVKQVIELAS